MTTPAAPPSRRLPPLTLLRTFDVVGQTTSLRRAAEDLGLSHSVISRQIRDLEAWMGTRLIERSARGTRLTPDGSRFHAAVARAFEQLADATAEAARDTHRAQLRIWCAPGLAARWLAPRIAAIEAELPGVDLVLRATDRRCDLAAGDADVEVSYADAADPRWRSVLLASPPLIPVANAAFLETQPPVIAPADLLTARLIHEESREQWRRWFEASGVSRPPPLDGPRLWDANLCLDAAASGQGIALAPAPLVTDDLAAGRLVKLLDSDVRLGSYYFATQPSRWRDPAAARLRAWLESALKQMD